MEDDVRIRRATPDDAESLIAHVHAVIDESGRFIPLAHDEFTMTPEEERKFLEKVDASGNSAVLRGGAGRPGGRGVELHGRDQAVRPTRGDAGRVGAAGVVR